MDRAPVCAMFWVLICVGSQGSSENSMKAAAKRSAGKWCGLALLAGGLWLPQARAVNVLTQHNDLSRTGANTLETILTPGNVNPTNFGKLFTDSVDAQVYAQPLYVENLNI